MRQEAEKEADQAVAQLEEFVKEQEKVVSKILHHNACNTGCSTLGVCQGSRKLTCRKFYIEPKMKFVLLPSSKNFKQVRLGS